MQAFLLLLICNMFYAQPMKMLIFSGDSEKVNILDKEKNSEEYKVSERSFIKLNSLKNLYDDIFVRISNP